MNAVEYCLLHGLKVAGSAHPALVSAEESLSYGALAARVAKYAGALRESGVKPGDRVAMVMLDTPDIVALHQAAMATGAVAAALSNRANVEELTQILAIVQPHTLVADDEFASAVAAAVAAASPKTRLLSRQRELRAWRLRPETELIVTPRAPNDPAFWVMTSGTTGSPKAVERTAGCCSRTASRTRAAKVRDPRNRRRNCQDVSWDVLRSHKLPACEAASWKLAATTNNSPSTLDWSAAPTRLAESRRVGRPRVFACIRRLSPARRRAADAS